jgi:lysophospholipase L1-like esterase
MRFNFIIIIIIIWLAEISDVTCQTLKILPLGNSLTKGTFCTNGSVSSCISLPDGETIGYRYALFNTLNTAGYDFNFVGNEIAGYSVFPDYNHAGYTGITSANLAIKLNDNSNYLMNSTQPDIVLLEIGTNDVYSGQTSIEGVRSILNEIGEYETTSGKPVLVFLSKIIRFAQGTYHENLVNTFNVNLQALYNQRKTAGDLIEWVDIGVNLVNKIEPLGDMMDELHPNQVGYDKMAQLWFQAIDNYNSAPVPTQIPNQITTEGNNFPSISLDNFITDAENADSLISWTVQSEPQNLTVTINGSRQAIVCPIDSDWYGTENITFIATDMGKTVPGLKKSASITVTFTVEPVNDPPVILSQTRIPATVEETSVSFSIDDLQVQDIDNPASDLTVQALSGLNYTYSSNTITPALNFFGELTVNIKVNDLQSSSQAFGFKISVSAINDPPVITSGNSMSFNEDTPFQLKLTDFQVSDPDNYFPVDFTLVIGNNPHYTHSGDTITPELNYNGSLQVPVRVRDLLDLSNEFLQTITILPVNDPPFILIPANRSVYEDDYFEIQLEPGDIDQTDILQLSTVSLPEWLTFNPVNNKLLGTLTHQYIDESIVIIRVNDTHVSIDSTFSLNINATSGIDDEVENKGKFTVYPNPASEYIRIKYNDHIDMSLTFKLFNISGIQLLAKEITRNDATIYLNSVAIPSGIYFYEIIGKNSDPIKGKLVVRFE